MTADEARGRVEAIRAMADDDEGAHSEEDRFREDVLLAISNVHLSASGARHARALARAALQTSEIEFARWCA